MRGSLEERFWSKVNVTDGCWYWLGATGLVGHGQMHVKVTPEGREKMQAHHVALLIAGRPLPQRGEHCHHTCETVSCVNPDHLVIVSAKGGIRQGGVCHRTLHAKWNRENLIAALQDCCRIHERTPAVNDFNRALARRDRQPEKVALSIEKDWPSYTALKYHFGSWSNAMVAAGFERPRKGCRPKPCDVPNLG